MIISLIQQEPGISRADLARALGFSEMASTRIVRELLEAELVEEIADAAPRAPDATVRLGRPKIGLRLRPDGLFAGGVTVSAYHSEVSICDAAGELRARKEIPYFVSDDIGETARAYGRELSRLIAEAGVDPGRMAGVGVALAARTSLKDNEIVRSDYFGWGPDGGAFERELRGALGLPIRIDNISNALATAEMRFGAARGVDDFVLVHVATLAGAAVMTGGKLIRGKDGISGMIGHVRSAPTAHRCLCGRNDCLNLNATGFGVLGKLGMLKTGGFDRSELQAYAAQLLDLVGRPDTAPLLEEAGAHMAPALDGVCKILGPEKIVVSGHVGSSAPYLRGLRAAAERDFGRDWFANVPIAAGEIAPTRAAALLALSAFCYSNLLDLERFSGDADASSAPRRA